MSLFHSLYLNFFGDILSLSRFLVTIVIRFRGEPLLYALVHLLAHEFIDVSRHLTATSTNCRDHQNPVLFMAVAPPD